MIISHKYKFIFVKTKKVAGTSLEIALSKYLGENDVATLVAEEAIREERGYRVGRDYRKKVSEIGLSDIKKWNGIFFKRVSRFLQSGRISSLPPWPRQYYAHMTAKEIRAVVDEDIWNSYFKFTIERNPWDWVVSYYYFWMKYNRDISFDEFVRSGIAQKASNLSFYTDASDVLVDKVIKYEEFDTALPELSERMGYPENLADIMKETHAKSHLRKVRDYHDLYNDETKALVAEQFKREIEMCGYQY